MTIEDIDPETGFTVSRIVCAANKLRSGRLVLGARHFDSHMLSALPGEFDLVRNTKEQGFVDQYGNFFSREDAWNIAIREGQVLRLVGNQTELTPGYELFSENLY